MSSIPVFYTFFLHSDSLFDNDYRYALEKIYEIFQRNV